jgi:CRP/FNR family transcriptional regulator, dissimilatory nitrate respiration regulator
MPVKRGHPDLPDAQTWSELLGGAPVTALQSRHLNTLCQWRRVDAGDWLYRRGDAADQLLAISQGSVALGCTAADGGFRTERQLQGPAWLDTAAAWLNEVHSADARAMDAVHVLALPRDAMVDLLERHPGLARCLIDVLAREVQVLSHNTHELMHKDAPGRLAAWLVHHAQSLPEFAGRAVVQLTMRKRDIASQLAITPETLSRLMRSLAGQGVLRVAGYTVHVLDLPALERMAQA